MIRPVLVDMTPNQHGLFTLSQVAILAERRGLMTLSVSDTFCEVRKGQGREPVRIMAHDEGLWHPINIFKACREAIGKPSYEVDPRRVNITNPGGLNEKLIADVIGADGVRPYLTRPGQYFFKAGEGQAGTYHSPHAAQMIAAFNEGFTIVNDMPRAEAGSWTWPMFALMCGGLDRACKSQEYRHALRTLDDVGLIDLILGAKGGMGTATFTWTPLAILQALTREEDKSLNAFAS